MSFTSRAPHPYSLRQLQYAVAVAEALNFRKAAAACHVAQPSLSAQVAQLEGVLGFPIFERTRRQVLVTPNGRAFLEQARALLVAADELLASAQRLSDPHSGTLRVGVIPTVSPYLLPAVTPALRKAFPRLSLLWQEDRTEPLLTQLREGTLDAVLLAKEAPLGDVATEEIGPDPFLLLAPKGHPLLQGPGALPTSALRDADVVLLEEGHCLRDQALSLCSKAKAHELEFRATSLSTLTQMVASGLGVTLIPTLAAKAEARRPEVKVRALASPSPHRTIALGWRRGSALAPLLKELAATLRGAYPR